MTMNVDGKGDWRYREDAQTGAPERKKLADLSRDYMEHVISCSYCKKTIGDRCMVGQGFEEAFKKEKARQQRISGQ